MSRPRLLADHDLNDAIVDGVRRIDPSAVFLKARDVGYDRLPDADLLARAADDGLIVVSHDVNTLTAAAKLRIASGLPMAGVLIARQTAAVGPVIADLSDVLDISEAEEWRDEVNFLPL